MKKSVVVFGLLVLLVVSFLVNVPEVLSSLEQTSEVMRSGHGSGN